MNPSKKNADRREKTRQNMLSAASKGFRSCGFEGIGVDAIAKEAGATSGAFYAHLGSKKKAFLLALESGLDEVIQAIPIFQKENGAAWVEAFADYYLAPTHREDLATGCAMTTLSPEIARQKNGAKELYTRKMNDIIHLISNGLAGESEEEKSGRAWSFLSALIGGLTIVRALDDTKEDSKIAASIKSTALVAAGEAIEIPQSDIARKE